MNTPSSSHWNRGCPALGPPIPPLSNFPFPPACDLDCLEREEKTGKEKRNQTGIAHHKRPPKVSAQKPPVGRIRKTRRPLPWRPHFSPNPLISFRFHFLGFSAMVPLSGHISISDSSVILLRLSGETSAVFTPGVPRGIWYFSFLVSAFQCESSSIVNDFWRQRRHVA